MNKYHKELCMHENAAMLQDEDTPDENLVWHLNQHAGLSGLRDPNWKWKGRTQPQLERHAFINTFSANLPLVNFSCACLAQLDESATNFGKWMIAVRHPVYR